MNIAITGSRGLIGTALTRALRERGEHVVRFVRERPSGPSDDVYWNPRTGELDRATLERVGPLDALVHLAGAGIAERRWSTARRAELVSSRVEATAHLAAQLTSIQPTLGCVISGSAIGYYGSRGDEVLTEASTPGDDFLGRLCQDWEGAVGAWRSVGTPVATIRTGVVYDRRGGALAKQLPLFRAGLAGHLGTGRQWMSIISLEDEVRAILSLIERPYDGAVNLVSPEPLTNRALTRLLARHLHRPAVLPVPEVALALVLGRDVAHDMILASQRVEPTVLSQRGFTFAHPTADAVVTAALAR